MLLLPAASSSTSNSSSSSNSTSILTVCSQCATIDMVFHILENSTSNNPSALLWNDSVIKNTINQQNVLWENTPFNFRLKGILRHHSNSANSTTPYQWPSDDPRIHPTFVEQVVAKFRIGGRTTANIFLSDNEIICSVGGYARSVVTFQFYPIEEFSPDDFIILCGNTAGDHNLLAHELGHWFSLAHTFEGESCDPSNPGDGVDDTPHQGIATPVICDPLQDTCPNSPGLDPVFNYMDYSSCQNKSFTPGQINKMYNFYLEYRALSKPCLSNQIKLQFDIQFDSQPSKVQLSFVTWGEKERFQYYPMAQQSDPMNLANKLVVGKICVNRHSAHEVILSQNGSVTFDAAGYFALSADGNDLARGNVSANSYILSLDTICEKNSTQGDSGRFRLELKFDEYPEDQEWYILDSQNNTVADYTLTTGYESKAYVNNFDLSILIFEKCLSKGVYRFQLMDNYEDGISAPGYYKIFLDGNFIAGSKDLFIEQSYILVEITFAVGSSLQPTLAPTNVVAIAPMNIESKNPTISPTTLPGTSPSKAPQFTFSILPHAFPTKAPSAAKDLSKTPTKAPKRQSNSPTKVTKAPTLDRNDAPISESKKTKATKSPTLDRNESPILEPKKVPTKLQTTKPPTRAPIIVKTKAPTKNPTSASTKATTKAPSISSTSPTRQKQPTSKPTKSTLVLSSINYFEPFI